MLRRFGEQGTALPSAGASAFQILLCANHHALIISYDFANCQMRQTFECAGAVVSPGGMSHMLQAVK